MIVLYIAYKEKKSLKENVIYTRSIWKKYVMQLKVWIKFAKR